MRVQSMSPPLNVPKPKGKRAMDTFLEEIKRCVYRGVCSASVHNDRREQAEREAKYARQCALIY